MKLHEEKRDPAFFREVDACYKQLEELKARSSHLRREGKDPTMGEFLLRNIIPKLHYAEVSRNMQEIEKIKATLNDAQHELDEAEHYEEPSFAKEIETLLKKTKS
jgi:hypothetical protein